MTVRTHAISPIALEVIEGCVRSAELEIEAAVERTARSPMIRDQHDYRVALSTRGAASSRGGPTRRWSR